MGEHSAHLLIFAATGSSVSPHEVRVLFSRSLILAVFAAVLPHAAWSAQRSTRVPPADILIVHGKIYTVEAAYSGDREKTEGSMEAGKVADVIIIDRNVFEIDPQSIHRTKVVFTIVGGSIVYETDHG